MNLPDEKREALVHFLHNEGDGGIWESFDRANAEAVADALAPLLAGWLAEAWDEGYRLACGDHGCSRRSRDHGQSNANPYRADEAAARSLRAALYADTAETTGGGE